MLKPCPTCGRRDSLLLNTNLLRTRKQGVHHVICDATNGGCGTSTSFYRTDREAIEAWERGDIWHKGGRR